MVCMVPCKHLYCRYIVLAGITYRKPTWAKKTRREGENIMVAAAILASNPPCLFGLLPRKNKKGGRVKTCVGCGSYTCLKPTSLLRLLARQPQKRRESENICWLWQLCCPQPHHFFAVCCLSGLMSQSPCEIH